MPGSLLQTIPLPNDLSLEFWSESRPTAGDRWYVGVRAVVAVPLAVEPLEEPLREIIRELKTEMGDSICYQNLKERHFVPAGQVEREQQEIIQIFLDNTLTYLAHPRFAERFIRRTAREVLEKKAWPEEHRQKILERLRKPQPGRV